MTKTIKLTTGLDCLVDDEDFDLVSAFSWHPHRARQRVERIYAYTKVGRASTSMHRMIMRPEVGKEVDHRNNDGLDNRRGNLRVCSTSQNNANKQREPGASGFVGVHATRHGKWKGCVQREGKRFYTAVYSTAQEAARARDALAITLFGEFASLNFQARA